MLRRRCDDQQQLIWALIGGVALSWQLLANHKSRVSERAYWVTR